MFVNKRCSPGYDLCTFDDKISHVQKFDYLGSGATDDEI